MARQTVKNRIVGIERGEELRIRCSELLCQGGEGDPVQNYREGVTLGDSLLDVIESVSTRMVVVYFNSCLLDSILEVR